MFKDKVDALASSICLKQGCLNKRLFIATGVYLNRTMLRYITFAVALSIKKKTR